MSKEFECVTCTKDGKMFYNVFNFTPPRTAGEMEAFLREKAEETGIEDAFVGAPESGTGSPEMKARLGYEGLWIYSSQIDRAEDKFQKAFQMMMDAVELHRKEICKNNPPIQCPPFPDHGSYHIEAIE